MSTEQNMSYCDRRRLDKEINNEEHTTIQEDYARARIYNRTEDVPEPQMGRREYKKILRKRQVRRQQMIIGAVILLSILIVSISSVVSVRIREKKKTEEQKAAIEAANMQAKEKGAQEDSARNEVSEPRETLEEKVARVKTLAKNKKYPEEVISLLDKNPETVDFVEAYGEKKDASPAASVGELVPGVIPHLLQWDERWGYSPYGGSIIAVSGCGPTCMAMVISGLTQDSKVTPVVLADYGTKNQYVDTEDNTYWDFMRDVGEHWGVSCYEGVLTEEQVAAELGAGKPIICSVSKGYFTQNGHFIVLTRYDNGRVKVNDPFSRENSDKLWDFSDIQDQIQAMWVYYIEK